MTNHILMALIGGCWRVVDGAGIGRTTIRSAVLLAIILTFMQSQADMLAVSAWPLWLWAVSIVVALQRGYRDWTLFDAAQILHYYPAAIPLPILVFAYDLNLTAPLIYVGLLLVAGLAHPVATKLNVHTRSAEFVAGACLVGGVFV
jgi:hypothetical protein